MLASKSLKKRLSHDHSRPYCGSCSQKGYHRSLGKISPALSVILHVFSVKVTFLKQEFPTEQSLSFPNWGPFQVLTASKVSGDLKVEMYTQILIDCLYARQECTTLSRTEALTWQMLCYKMRPHIDFGRKILSTPTFPPFNPVLIVESEQICILKPVGTLSTS